MPFGIDKLPNFNYLPAPAKVLVLVVLLGLVTGIYYVALYRPLNDDLEVASRRFEDLKQKERTAEARKAEFVRVSEALLARRAIDQRNRRTLPEEAEIAAFLKDLNRVAELCGLDISLVQPRAEQPQALYVKVPVNLGLRGTFHQVFKFFYNVSKLDRAINLENVRLKLAKPEGGESSSTLEVEVLATTFRKPSPPATPPPASAALPSRKPDSQPAAAVVERLPAEAHAADLRGGA